VEQASLHEMFHRQMQRVKRRGLQDRQRQRTRYRQNCAPVRSF
jgi:hypothetical protein